MSWKIDPAHAVIEFSVRHLMISTVRGRFTRFSGTLDLDEAHPERSYVGGTIEVDSLESHDADRDAHLRSADFFDVENYPAMTFRSTRVEPAGHNRFKVVGDLTIKDVTREVVFDVTGDGPIQDPWGGRRWGFSAQTTLNRKDFGLTWNVALEAGGWAVGDEVKVAIELEAIEEQVELEALAA